jgi:hypothetical protein
MAYNITEAQRSLARSSPAHRGALSIRGAPRKAEAYLGGGKSLMVSIALSHRLRFLSMCSAKVLAESVAACGFAQERRYLMVPPPLRSGSGADVRAPLGHWIISASYDTADACESGRRQYQEKLPSELRAHPSDKAFAAWARQATPLATCIATDDPRLKEK